MQPEKKFKAGAISVTVWKNEAMKDKKKFEYHTVNLERNYKDKVGKWQTTNTLRIADVPKAAMLLNKCYEFLTMQEEVETEEIY